MPFYDIKVSATVIVRDIEAASPVEAQQLVVADLAGRFPKQTTILQEETIAEDVTGVE